MSDDNYENIEDEVIQDEQAGEVDAVREAFDSAIAAELEEDEVKLAMIQDGATFKNVTRLYNQFMIDAGLAISKEDRNKLVEDTLEGRDFETEDEFNSAVADLVEAVTGSTERSAAALVRGYAKKNELPCYTKPKGQGGTKSGFAHKFYAYLTANPLASKEEAIAFIQGEGDHEDTSENVKRHQSHYLAIWQLVNTIATDDTAKAA